MTALLWWLKAGQPLRSLLRLAFVWRVWPDNDWIALIGPVEHCKMNEPKFDEG